MMQQEDCRVGASARLNREERLSKVRDCARRSLESADIERIIDMGETLEALPDLRQLMLVLGHKSVK